MEIFLFITWILFGLLGCYIYNKNITYDAPWLKYVWNFIVCSMGWIGFMVACLTWLTLKLDNTKKS
jgi:hypothetical protein